MHKRQSRQGGSRPVLASGIACGIMGVRAAGRTGSELPGKGAPWLGTQWIRIMRTVYVETSVVSYLAAKPSRDLVVAARQQTTHEWWSARRGDFTFYVSELVLAECAGGDPDAAQRRTAYLADIPSLAISADVETLAAQIVRGARLPAQAQADALHIAVAAAHGIEFLVTWNLAHIANAELRPLVEAACRAAGVEPPVLCTPDELMGGEEAEYEL